MEFHIEEDGVVRNREILTGMYLVNAIIPKDGIQHIRLLNTTEEKVIVHNINIDTIPLSKYDIITAIQRVQQRKIPYNIENLGSRYSR